ncbi:hypothetical protein QJS10_CPB17g00222 [Acorus calamus]|uniref:Replication termination factor 2 n=1 Tax=Acorus calamus TaxID=4465 RepID=A0AAV9CYT2_ACOCL|nr:hypothetical protein QJS10_CPB17g00222 [Acorus calamus]
MLSTPPTAVSAPSTLPSSLPMEIQIFIESPDLHLPSRSLTANPNCSLRDLKLSFLSIGTLIPSETLNSIYFSFNGRPLPDSSTLSGIPPHSTLTLRSRALLGGGGDGGATGAESRDCYLKMYATKKPDKADPNEARISRWTTCALSSEPLQPPCVVDRLGNVFNKETLVQAMLEKKLPPGFGHIRGLKDMFSIELCSIPGVRSDDDKSFDARFQCPITGLEFNGNYGFFALRQCGHVLSSKALKEVKSSGCLVCHKEFSVDDKIVINGSAEEVAVLRERMEEERAKMKEKREKRVKNGKPKEELDGEIVRTEVGGRPVKRFKALDVLPANATKEVYASIFTSSKKSDFKETYSCRSLPLGRN